MDAAPRLEPCGAGPIYEWIAGDGRPSRSRLVDCVHDGDVVPAESGVRLGPSLRRDFVRERDHGAARVAAALAAELGCGGFHRLKVARCAFDFNRRFGVTAGSVAHLETLAVSPEFARRAGREGVARMHDLFERAEREVEHALRALDAGALRLSIHSYDELGADGTRRCALSLLHSTASDPVHRTAPDERVAAIVDALERQGFAVARHWPYPLPEGSLELRLARRSRPDVDSIVVEVRKDLLFEGVQRDGGFVPRAERPGAAERIGAALAAAIR